MIDEFDCFIHLLLIMRNEQPEHAHSWVTS